MSRVGWVFPPRDPVGRFVGIAGMPENVHYVSVVVDGPDSINLYSNFDGFNQDLQHADLLVHSGTWSRVGGSTVALPIRGYLRTNGIARGPSGVCYGLLRISNGYGGSQGYQPAWATSDADCRNWRLRGFTSLPHNSNNNTLVVQEDGPAVVDHGNPMANRYVALDDGLGPKLALIYSADGINWFDVKDPVTRQTMEIWPNDANEVLSNGTVRKIDPQFVTMTRTPYGWHAIAADWYADSAHRHIHIYAPAGQPLKWRMLEASAPTFINTNKGTALTYYQGTVYAVTAGVVLSFSAKAF
jgi:hypothetical protein